MSFYIIIRGPAGCGKTTISKLLAEKLNAAYVSFDEAVAHFQKKAAEGRGLEKESFLKANELVANEASNNLKEGKIVIFDGCFYHKEQLDDLEKSLPYEHYVFDLKASVEECISRDQNRKSIGEDAIRAVHGMVSAFDYGTPINTEGKTQDAVVCDLLEIIDNGNKK